MLDKQNRWKYDWIPDANELHLHLEFASGRMIWEMHLLEIVEHTLPDTLKLVPFLFLTYLVMEYLEHKTGDKTQKLVKKAGNFGPVIGGILGIVPQCGFSAAAANLFTGHVITLGTLIAICLSTSDEMLPILLSEKAPVELILKILLAKAAIGMVAGLLIDMVLRRKGEPVHEHIHDICEQEHCHCEKGILRSAISHTLQITFFIFVVSFGLNLLLHVVGEDVLGNLILNRKILGPVLASVVGLVPNCAGSVVITQLYLQGAMGTGAMLAGLLTGSGVGLLVLFRVNHDKKECLKILGLLYGIGVIVGIVTGFIVG